MAAPVSSRLRLFPKRCWRDFLPVQDLERRSQRNEHPVPTRPMELSLLRTGDINQSRGRRTRPGWAPPSSTASATTREVLLDMAHAGPPLDWLLQQRGLLPDGNKIR